MTLYQNSSKYFGTQASSLTGALASFRQQEQSMADTNTIQKTNSEPTATNHSLSPNDGLKFSANESSASSANGSSPGFVGNTQENIPSLSPLPSPNLLSRNASLSDLSSFQEDWEVPPESLTVFDFLDNLALPNKLENWQAKLARQAYRVKRQREKLKSTTSVAKDRVVEEWRRRLPPPDEQLVKYRRRMKESVERLGTRWNDAKAVTAREKLSFIAGVMNIFISGYLIGAHPDLFHWWFSVQLAYFMPIRWYTYHQRGYHYFLADLCYTVNFMLLLSIWIFPRSKRLFISTYCLAYGNNAVAIAMWRNSLVFHSLDKVTSLFIHIMPPVTLHCLVHLTTPEIQQKRFPAIYAIRTSDPENPIHYNIAAMMFWSSLPYAIWQLSYHFFITVRRKDKIAAGRPTSFTWLQKSYAKSWIGKIILGLPKQLQEPAFMLTQYLYALGSMLPCPIWFWYRYPSAGFLIVLFAWSIYNGATYYIDVFGKRFQKELEQMKTDVAKWQASPEVFSSPLMTPKAEHGSATPHQTSPQLTKMAAHKSESSIDQIPLLDSPSENSQTEVSTGIDASLGEGVRERR